MSPKIAVYYTKSADVAQTRIVHKWQNYGIIIGSMLPSQHIVKLLKHSTPELKHAAVGMMDAANPDRNQLLMPDYRDGLRNALTAYREVLVDKPMVVPMRRNIENLIAEYAVEWSRLLDAVRKADNQLNPLIGKVRAKQKAAHERFVDILKNGTGNGDGRAEYDALTAALTALSEQMGDNAQSAAKRSRKGCKREPNFATPVWQAAIWAGVGEATIRRYWNHPKKGLPRPPLNVPGPPEARKALFEEWGRQYRGLKAAKSEARAMNHAARYHDLDNIGDSKDDSEEES